MEQEQTSKTDAARPAVRSETWLGCDLIAAERRRQVEQEGWSVEHDNGHDKGQLAMAAAAYAHHATYAGPGNLWPWGMEWWKPGVGRTLDTRIRALAKAGALIAAEIDRLNRLRIGDGAQHPNGGDMPRIPAQPRSANMPENTDKNADIVTG